MKSVRRKSEILPSAASACRNGRGCRGGLSRKGFTLLELLATLAVIATLTTMGALGLTGSLNARKLSAAGNATADFAGLARQCAVSKNTLVALIVLTSDPEGQSDLAYRALAIMEYNGGTWTQTGKWHYLPKGIFVDPDLAASSFLKSLAVDAGEADWDQIQVRHLGKPVSKDSYACRFFLPSGSLMNPDQPATIRLVEGELDGASNFSYRKTDSDGAPVNYYDLSLLGVTGMAKVARK